MPLPHRRNLRVRSLAVGLACRQLKVTLANHRQAEHRQASLAHTSPGSRADSRAQPRGRPLPIKTRQALADSKPPVELRPTPQLMLQNMRQDIRQNM